MQNDTNVRSAVVTSLLAYGKQRQRKRAVSHFGLVTECFCVSNVIIMVFWLLLVQLSVKAFNDKNKSRPGNFYCYFPESPDFLGNAKCLCGMKKEASEEGSIAAG